ncbi:hypothetical protein [Clostridium butanoliproducens]|uniref:hypothetical protein n=1 Tax=Clostridium butanoliproducens TaxID=2991837 RepID=UPI0024BB079E|nr:hypothetical protein [Clostridium butanoliproducens]
MTCFNNYNLNIVSDFEIKTFREDENDIDLLISLDNRTLNLNVDSSLIKSRMQFTGVQGILIRACKGDNNIATIHLLKDKGIHSTICNFEIDYSNLFLEINSMKFYVEMSIAN